MLIILKKLRKISLRNLHVAEHSLLLLETFFKVIMIEGNQNYQRELIPLIFSRLKTVSQLMKNCKLFKKDISSENRNIYAKN